jgi:hypothetical protein
MSVQSANQSYQEFYTTATSANASGATPKVFFSSVLPAGTWVIVGSVVLTPTTGNITTYELSTVARPLSGITVASGGPTSVRVPVSTIVYSDGLFTFTISAACTTSAGDTWNSAGGNIFQCYRITNF